MKALAVDTSSNTLVSSIKTDSYVEESNICNPGLQHSEKIMVQINELCSHAGIKTKDLDLLVCTRGPGSFTGLRIAMSTLKGISTGSGAPVVSVSTLETWANTVKDFNGAVVTVIDAKKQRWYLASFECKEGKVSRLMPDTDGTVADLVETLNNYSDVLVVGPDKQSFLPVIEKAFPQKRITLENPAEVSFATSLMELGISQFNEKGPDDIGQGPVYIRKSDAEVALLERLKVKQND